MTEGTKTGIFCGLAVIATAIATLVSWPTATTTENDSIGRMLFEKFEDPLSAASLKIVTFDEEQGQLDTFEVRKDRETGLWTIPSRDGYPADAIEQMKNAANALVGVKILDIQTSNAEDHDDLGVVEPKVESLEVGDEGVGRLVTFKDEKQETLASLIIGDAVKEDETKRYVRVPNQDPVYVVKFDESPLTTNFRDWIEDDLLQMSSIDIENVQIKDYTASLGARGISVSRTYTAELTQEGTDWQLDQLLEFDPQDPRIEAKTVEVGEDQELNDTKLDEMKNALDDLKIVGVYRKPAGVSETLKASADLLSDQDAITSLAQRGFYPVEVGLDGEAEILSANGELSVSLKDGVKYLLRFGNIAGVTDGDSDIADDESESEDSEAGVNRYLFVTTMVDDSKFPPPELTPIPQTFEELDAILNPPDQSETKTADTPNADSERPEMTEAEPTKSEPEADAKEDAGGKETADDQPESEKLESEKAVDEKEMKDDAATDDSKTSDSKTSDSESKQKAPDDAKPESDDAKPESDNAKPESDASPKDEGETTVEGTGEATGSGQALQDSDDQAESEDKAESAETDKEADKKSDAEEKSEEMTAEERQELLEAEQEKITKENQRKLDARKDEIEDAKLKVKQLNERFADWYYVIPESTYAQLRIERKDLFKSGEDDAAATNVDPLQGGPQFQFPGVPGAGTP